MHWAAFIVVALGWLTLQSTLATRLELLGARPDWLLVLVVFYAMHARMPDAAVAAWLLGAGADLMTIERPGLLAMSYLLAAAVVAPLRDYFFRYRAVTQFGMTLAAGLFLRLGWCTYRWAMHESGRSVISEVAIDVVLASIYTALWAPPVHTTLLAVSSLLGINRPRYTYAGSRQTRDAGV